MERVGEHVGAVWKSVNLIPDFASESRAGVRTSPPKGPISEKPISSTTINKMLGRVSFANNEEGQQIKTTNKITRGIIRFIFFSRINIINAR
jgi:hypothetical protein